MHSWEALYVLPTTVLGRVLNPEQMAMPGFLEVFGYYDGEKEKWSIDPTVQQLISSLMTIGTFVGSLLVGPFSSKFGRKYGLWVASAINMVATAIMLGTTHLGALYFARLILGTTINPH